MTALRTPLEVALGTRLDLDFDDLDLHDLDAQEEAFEAREAALVAAAIDTAEVLQKEALKKTTPRLGGVYPNDLHIGLVRRGRAQ